MQAAIAKWGNSLAVRLPKGAADDLRIADGSPVDLRVEGDSLIITPRRPRYKLADLLSKMTAEHKRSEYDWGEPHGKEAW
jgi:antitoxin MazE